MHTQCCMLLVDSRCRCVGRVASGYMRGPLNGITLLHMRNDAQWLTHLQALLHLQVTERQFVAYAPHGIGSCSMLRA